MADTTIGENITVDGEISGEATVVVEGTVRGNIDTDSEIARQWAERVYESYRERSDPVAV